MRNWQDMPASTNVQDMTYGPQQSVAPRNMGPVLPPNWSPSGGPLPRSNLPTPMPQGPQRQTPQGSNSPSRMDPQLWQRLIGGRPPPSPEAQRWYQQNMPAQLPTTPIAGSGPSGLMFMGSGNTPLVQSSSSAPYGGMGNNFNTGTYTSIRPDRPGSHQIPESAQMPLPDDGQFGMTLNSMPWSY